MAQDPAPEVYLLYIWLRRINPLIWRRVLVRTDTTLADLHYIIQIAFSWTDFHRALSISPLVTRIAAYQQQYRYRC
jgi:hypothetical protein